MPISFDSPCRQDWSTFTGVSRGVSDAEARHCQSCDTTVIDMTRLTRRAAEKMVIAAGGKMCGRLRVDASGAPIYRRETERAPGLLGLAAASLLAACGSTTEEGTVAASSTEAPSTGGDHLLEEGLPTSGSLATPMMPLADDRDMPPEGTAAPSTTIAAIVTDDTDAEVVPTADQLLLTEAKDGDERPAQVATRRHRDHGTTTTTATAARGRRNNGAPPVVTSPTSSLPAINTPPDTMVMMGGISYTP